MRRSRDDERVIPFFMKALHLPDIRRHGRIPFEKSIGPRRMMWYTVTTKKEQMF